MDQLPSTFGRRLIPHILDDIAALDPSRSILSIPKSRILSEGYEDISSKTFADAVNRCAWWMSTELGKAQTSKALLYLAPLDIRYLVVAIAAVKTGHYVSVSRSNDDCET